MTDVELDALEAAAKAATPGPWVIDPFFDIMSKEEFVYIDEHDCIGYVKNINYIAAANPAAVLDLIAELRQARRERDWLAVNLANGLVDPGCIEHLAELGGMSPPDPATLIEAAKEDTNAPCKTAGHASGI